MISFGVGLYTHEYFVQGSTCSCVTYKRIWSRFCFNGLTKLAEGNILVNAAENGTSMDSDVWFIRSPSMNVGF